ncbi:TPA: hypothetical protein ONU04_001247 [Enterococcus faecium]|jgi:hypothetical protein|uniref:Uncharacterized protein n=6 Tax=Bacteria TaxID=2 RepID=A0A2H4HI36_ENTFL|nr:MULTISPECIES: hypothetical protein [Enterococcus]EEV55067.1 conserved hypothetical protein [Enterococcus faecium 1,231,410]EJY10782.1 hypothetical protein HMPREF1361_00472 [Enterococcus faecium ERV1]EJY13122.1 hypothetical protein HMPREF1359_01406 [Enterococcus faecium E417]KKJ67708.1 hypothetical protein T639_09190 [Enterococcus faecium MRSN 11639]KXW79707.1 hypothetical protein AU251_15515 [Enterococcus faecium C68]MBM1152667.1 hypothetical protein [Enterococcus durans]MBU5547619.1 hypo
MISMARPRKYNTEEERKEAMKKARKKWVEKNQETIAYIRAKSFAKKFIEMSEDEDIELLEKWLEDRKNNGQNDE